MSGWLLFVDLSHLPQHQIQAVGPRYIAQTPITQLLVAGASKRGWTTWLTGVYDLCFSHNFSSHFLLTHISVSLSLTFLSLSLCHFLSFSFPFFKFSVAFQSCLFCVRVRVCFFRRRGFTCCGHRAHRAGRPGCARFSASVSPSIFASNFIFQLSRCVSLCCIRAALLAFMVFGVWVCVFAILISCLFYHVCWIFSSHILLFRFVHFSTVNTACTVPTRSLWRTTGPSTWRLRLTTPTLSCCSALSTQFTMPM